MHNRNYMRLHENVNIFIHGPGMFFAAPHMVLMKISGAGRYETECRQPMGAEEMSTVGGSVRSGKAPVRTLSARRAFLRKGRRSAACLV